MTGLSIEVRGRSMEPALKPGARLTAIRPQGALQRGDIILVKPLAAAQRVEIKRVVGLPTERVDWTGIGAIRINGVALPEPYASISEPPPGDDEIRTVKLGAGEYFVAGDNRLFSDDSRRYGPIARRSIVGVVRRW